MKTKLRLSFTLAIVVILAITSLTSAQYPGYQWGTAYQLVNTGDASGTISVNYYDQNGVEQTGSARNYADLPPLGSVLVVQKKDDPGLNGTYSAIISADVPTSAIVNQQLYLPGGTNPYPPFSSYSGFSSGSRNVFLPAIMYNYYNFYTEIYIMNVGSSPATVDIRYYPATVQGSVIGKSGVTEQVTVPANASKLVSQQAKTALGEVRCGTQSCFFGSATLSSTQDIAVVVNQHNPVQKKLMTYNGVASGAVKLAVPNYMRTYYEYYTALTISNMDATNPACVRLTYTPDPTQSKKVNGTPIDVNQDTVVVEHVIPPLNSLLRFDGFTATDDQSDLDDLVNYSQFFGTVQVESFIGSIGSTTCSSAVNLAGIINIESRRDRNSQGGSFNAIDVSSATNTIIAPIILADYYGYYTNLTIQNTTNLAGTCTFTYMSGPDSSVPNQQKSYTHPITPFGQITIYEGRKGTPRGDINTDPFWNSASGRRFIGAAKIVCDSGVKVVGFTNEEKDIMYIDSMYTFSTINR